MKLYTEKQLETAIMTAYISTMHKPIEIEVVYYGLMNELTPIELPSDEEIDTASLMISKDRKEFLMGAKYIIDKIQGGNK